MSITDELREIAVKTECASGRCEKLYRGDLEHIADRIDAEHEQQMAERRRSCVFYDAERNYCKVHDEGDMAELGYVRLPVDADGEYIHVGDVMEWPTTGETFEVVGIGDGTLFYIEDGNELADWTDASTKRHHHEPTVEDVLREFGRGWHERIVGPETFDIADYVERYAAKLRLAGDVE